MLTLYDYFRSSACFRVRIALNLKGLSYEKQTVHLVKDGGEQLSAEYKKINPQALVPTLLADKKPLTQSLAIIEYLDEVYPQPALLPADPYLKAVARSLALSIAADLHPLNNLRVMKFLTTELEVSEDKKNQWYQHWLKLGLSALEQQLSVLPTTGKFCFGDIPGLVDLCLVPQVYNARRYHCDMSAYPLITRIDAHCQAHPAFIAAWPNDLEAEIKG